MNDVRLTQSPRRFLSSQRGVSCRLQRIRIWSVATNPSGPDQNWRKKLWPQFFSFFFFANHTEEETSDLCVIGEMRIGRLSAAVWLQPERRATILTGLRWRESRGCWPVLRHSWNSKQQRQELKHYTQASHTPPLCLSHFLTSPPHPASLLSEVLEFSYSSSSSSSLHPTRPPSLSVVSPPIEFLPHLSSSSSGALQRGYGLIWISECISTSSSLGHGVVLRPHSCGGVMGPSAQGSLS